mmetsp:Transcript_66971/g.143218  ORF Transcript_66971/g.143218 Transcript_66971/m.143218 type:complete len:250 (-) Transcript_66971:48-797(-)
MEMEQEAAFRRGFSVTSEKALQGLSEFDAALSALEAAATATEQQCRNGTAEVGALKTQLAQLEARAKQLEGRVDDVHVSELNSGREQARVLKKDQLRRLEHLFEQVDGIFRLLAALGSAIVPWSASPKVPQSSAAPLLQGPSDAGTGPGGTASDSGDRDEVESGLMAIWRQDLEGGGHEASAGSLQAGGHGDGGRGGQNFTVSRGRSSASDSPSCSESETEGAVWCCCPWRPTTASYAQMEDTPPRRRS